MEASGLTINLGKSVVLVSKEPTAEELSLLGGLWPNCKVVKKHKIVGVWYGFDLRAEERYHEAVQKFHERLEQLSVLNLSLPMRILAANVFLFSHFSFLNRFLSCQSIWSMRFPIRFGATSPKFHLEN